MREWMINIVVYMLLCSFLHNIAPNGQYKKYTKFLMGIIMLVIVLQPVSYIMSFGEGDTLSVYADSLELYLQESKLEEDSFYDYYDMSLAAAGKQYLREQGITAEQISVTKDQEGKILKITVYMEAAEAASSFSDTDIKNFISQFYNLETGRIYIVR